MEQSDCFEELSFLRDCQKKLANSEWQCLVMSNKYPLPSCPSSRVLVSQYVICLKLQQIKPSHLKPNERLSAPVLFAAQQMALSNKGPDQQHQYRILISLLENNYLAIRHRHIVMHNIAKIYELLCENSRALFCYESLLKQTGTAQQNYVYGYTKILMRVGRNEEAFALLTRHMSNPCVSKDKIEQLFIVLLGLKYKRDGEGLGKQISKYFHKRELCLTTLYNLGLLFCRSQMLARARETFEKLESKLQSKNKTNKSLSMLLKTKINLLHIYQQIYLAYQSKDDIEGRYRRQKTQQVYEFLVENIEGVNDHPLIKRINSLISSKRQCGGKKTGNHLPITNRSIQQGNRQLAISSECAVPSIKRNEEKVHRNRQCGKIHEGKACEIQQKQCYQRKMRFLLRKQKQLKNFFNQVIYKNPNNRNQPHFSQKIEHRGNLRKGKVSPLSKCSKTTEQAFEVEFEKKKKKYHLQCQGSEAEEVIKSLLEGWTMQCNDKNSKNDQHKCMNINKVRKFVKVLETGNEDSPQTENFKSRVLNKRTQMDKQNHNDSSARRKGSELSQGKSTRSYRHLASNRVSDTLSKGQNEIASNRDELHKPESEVAQKRSQLENYQSLPLSHLVDNSPPIQANSPKQATPLRQSPTKGGYQLFDQMLQQGQLFEQQKKHEEAHDTYAKMYKEFKEQKQKETILLKIAKNFEKLGLTEQAEKTFIKCTKFDSAEALYCLGNLQINNGLITQGIENLEKANCLRRYDLKIELKLVYAYSILDETTNRALALVNSILQRHPECIEALIMASKILQKKRKIREALDISTLICEYKSSPAMYHYTGILFLEDSNVNRAFRYFQLALKDDPHHVPSMIELATILSETDPKQSISLLKNAINEDQRNKLAYARLGKIYETIEHDYESALDMYMKGLDIEETYESYIRIGDCYVKMGETSDAIANFGHALALKKTAEVYERIGQIHDSQHQQKNAIEAYSSALAQIKIEEGEDTTSLSSLKRSKYLLRLGSLCLSLSDHQLAYNYLRELSDITESFETCKMLGQAAFGKGDFSQALSHFKQAASMLEEDNIELMESIAMCFDKQEEYLTSKEIYEKILQVYPSNTRCSNNLANIFLILGKTNEAFYWFEFMLQHNPTNVEKRLRVADIYATIGDWSKVEQHLLICCKQRQNDIRVLEKMANLYKEKRDMRMVAKFEKKLALLRHKM